MIRGFSPLPSTLLVVILLCPYSVFAGSAAGSDLVFGACTLALGPVHFLDHGARSSKLVELCQNQLRIKSFYLCIRKYGLYEGVEGGLQRQNQTCQAYLNRALPPFNIIDDYSDDDISKLKHLEVKDRENAVLLEEIALVSGRLYTAAYDTLVLNPREIDDFHCSRI
jgi:hypothetical protein